MKTAFGIRPPLVFSFIFLPLVLHPSPPFADELKIVAVVNDEVITEAELQQALVPVVLQLQASHTPEDLAQKEPEIREKILQQLIEEKLMLQAAAHPRPIEFAKGKIGTPPAITVSDEEVERVLKRASSRFESLEAFQETLEKQGLTLEQLKGRYRDQLTIQKLVDREVRSRIDISPTEVTSYYEVHPEEFKVPLAVQVATILIQPKDSIDVARTKRLAEDLRSQLLKGADFYDLARRYSDGPNARMGGGVGFLEQGKVLKELEEVLFKLKEGEISPVVKTDSGFHLFRIESIRPPRVAALDEVKTEIMDQLFQQKMAAGYEEWINKLKSDAYISIK